VLEFCQLCRIVVSKGITPNAAPGFQPRFSPGSSLLPNLRRITCTRSAGTNSFTHARRRSDAKHGKKTQENKSLDTTKASKASSNDSPKIQDNSFLVEEAYNQEFGVVQHIQNFQRYWNSKDWIYTFTQEWPVDASPRHQLSYTLVALHSGDQPASSAGFGDVILNYRYQLLGNGESKVAFAPRFSVLLPTGDYRFGRGVGGAGIQGLLPLSVVVTRKLVTHWNVGTTIIPNAKNALRETGTTFGYNFGQSFVWLAHPRFNALLETVFNRSQRVTGQKTTEWTSDLLLSPGIRWAYNFKNGLQIVPGVAVPFGVGPSEKKDLSKLRRDSLPACGQRVSRVHDKRAASSIDVNNLRRPKFGTHIAH
jgi:hypothetical protein